MSKHRTPTPAEVRAAVVDLFQRRPEAESTPIARKWAANWRVQGFDPLGDAIDAEIDAQTPA